MQGSQNDQVDMAGLRLSTLLVCAALGILSSGGRTRRHSKEYVNSWAVEIRGGKLHADEVARRNGFENLGEMGGLPDFYHFKLIGPQAVNIKPDTPYASNLEADESVEFAEQQYYEERVPHSYIIPDDPLFPEQWNLLNTGTIYENTTGIDLNVEPAWIQGLTGCNVTVAIVDDGLDFRHPDIWPNFAPAVSFDYTEYNNSDPSSYRETHGTSVGGIVAAAPNNGYCGVGIAYEANIGGIKADIARILDMTEVRALSHRRDIVDIYSNSWGPPDLGFIVAGPRPLARRALQKGISEGRNGKGSIYVFANGNGGPNDDCGADGYASSIYTISVGAMGLDRNPSSYDEECSAKMVTAYVTDMFGYSTIRTSRTGKMCDSGFSGTSAATPMVTGAIALALEANPNLTWRDVQYLIVYTANPLLTNMADTQINGAGLAVSHRFGFGVLDTEALVTRARHWINVPPQMNDSVTEVYEQQVPDAPYSGKVNYTGPIRYLEHVVVQMTVEIDGGVNRGDLQIELTSPSQTLSILVSPRPKDDVDRADGTGYINWPFMSVMFWGEDPTGEWTLIIKASGWNYGAILSKVEFQFYGVSEVPEAVANIPAQCHSDCRRGCAREGSNYCDSCVNLRNAYTLECIDQCPPGYTERNGYCYNASLPIKECNSPLKSKEGTEFTEEYEPIGCRDARITECCTDGDSDCILLHPTSNCFCDNVCHYFGDCCHDAYDIGCSRENVSAPEAFPYIELGVTPGRAKRSLYFSIDIPGVKFPFAYSLLDITVGVRGIINVGDGILVPFLGSYSGSASYEIHHGVFSQDILSFASSIVNAYLQADFSASWLIAITWTQYQGNATNTFQGVLVTDFLRSYSIFTYKCGDMNFTPSDPFIGFLYDGQPFISPKILNRDGKAHLISCINQPDSPWVNVVYPLIELDGLFPANKNECAVDNGPCDQICTDIFRSYECSCEDGYTLNSDGHTCSAQIPGQPVEMQFSGDTPAVVGDRIYVQVTVSPTRALLCQLITRGPPQMPNFIAEHDCTGGEVIFHDVPAGEHRVRVVAGDRDAVVRSHVIVMPDNPDFCSLNAINEGVTRQYHYNGTLSGYQLQWRPIGDDVGFLCVLGDSETAVECSSPYTYNIEYGVPSVTRVKVIPDPRKCRGKRRPLVFTL